MAKDELFHVFLLIILLSDTASGLSISQPSLTKNVDDSFLVICKDEAGQSVTWTAPGHTKGPLNAKSHPQVQHGSYGTAIYFHKTKKSDEGNYTCSLTSSPRAWKVFSLRVQDKKHRQHHNRIPTSTETDSSTISTITHDNSESKEDYDFNFQPDITTTTEIIEQIDNEENIKPIDTTTEVPEILTTTRKYNKDRLRPHSNDIEVLNIPKHFGGRNKHKHQKPPLDNLMFENTPHRHVATEGEDFTIPCRTNMKGVQITWSLANGKNMDDKIQSLPEGLYIPNLGREDAQVYQCQAVHPESGKYNHTDIELVVHHKPFLPYNVFAEEEEVYAFLDEQVNLTCEVESNPPPKFKWHNRKMGKVLKVSSHKSVLQLNVTEQTPGKYQCTAYNALGKLEKYFDVQLGEHPDTPTNVELVEATSNSLEIKVEVAEIPYEISDPLMDPKWIVVEYKPVGENEWYSEEFNITSDSIVLTNLSKNTKYEVQAATKNIAGLSDFYFNNTIFETSLAKSVHITPIVTYSWLILSFIFWIA